MKKQFEIKAKSETEAELLVYGDIGENWWGDSVTAKDTAEQLSKLDVKNITVRINSYGGSVSDGLAIFNSLRNHNAAINVRIDGVAVSIASLIAMAGDTVRMSENALFMVHAPWGGAMGNAKDMREYADVLDIYAKAMTSSYARKTNQDNDTILNLLTDGEDHWYTAEEAKAFGFVDEIIEEEMAAAAGFDQSRFADPTKRLRVNVLNYTIESNKQNYLQTPAASVAAITNQQENKMTDTVNNEATDKQVADEETIKAQVKTEIKAKERDRKAGIRSAFEPFKAREGIQDLLDKCIDDDAVDIAKAQAKLLDQLGRGAEPLASNPRVDVTEDQRDKRINAAADVLLVRAGVHRMQSDRVAPVNIDVSGNPFRGSTLMDIARDCLRANGKKPDGLDKRSIVGMAFQTTSDFPILLENTMHKVLQTAYMTAPDTWSRFCKIGSVSDFRAHNRYRTGSIGNLDTLSEHGEFKNKTIPDGEKESITATTKGNLIGITREVIINDDLQALTDLATMLGRSYKRTIEAAVYAALAENSGLGPTMSDTLPLFDAGHSNIGAGAAISMLALEADRVLMASQMDVGANDYLDLKPAKLLVPIGIGGTARSINEAQYDPDTANKLQKPNIVNGLYDDIIDTARLTGTRRYSFADPNEAPVLEVAFLDGEQEPYVETKDGWNVDGAELKVRGDFGVAAIDYRGAVTDAGA